MARDLRYVDALVVRSSSANMFLDYFNVGLVACHRRFPHFIEREPRRGGFQPLVYIVDVLYAFALQPFPESVSALLGIHRDAVLPGGASAEDAIEFHAGFCRQGERLIELGIADAGCKINERLCSYGSGAAEVLHGFLP